MATTIHTTNSGQHEVIKIGSAIVAGLAGAIVVAIILAIAGASHMVNLNLPMMFGGTTTSPNTNPYYMGAAIDLIAGAIIGVIYAAFYAWTNILPNWANGLGFGFVQWVIFGLVLGSVQGTQSSTNSAPGMFMANYGIGAVVSFLILNLIFGAVVGAIYKPNLESTTSTTQTTEL